VILAIDQGTSATKACVFDPSGATLGAATVPVGRKTGRGGEVTQDPDELVRSCREAARAALRDAGVPARDLAGAALANQGESFVLFEQSGRAVTPIFGWQDVTCGDVLARVEQEAGAEAVAARTGLPLHAEFTAPKLAYRLAQVGHDERLRFGTLDTWLLHELDPSRPHVTDRATASRTMLIGLDDDDWSDELLGWFGVPRAILPGIVPCDEPGVAIVIDGVEVPVWASGYDMGLALLGHGCVAPGEIKATFGTCLGVMASTGAERVVADGLLTAIAYGRGGRSVFGLDGEIAAAGALVSWAIRVGIAGSPAELDARAASVADSGGAIVVPAIGGLGAPHWRDDVHGMVLGLTDATGRDELARAVLDAIAWSLRDVVAAARAAGYPCDVLRVDGGLVASETLMRRCADVAGVRLVVSAQPEATAFGAAALAMLRLGLLDDAGLAAAVGEQRRIEPGPPPAEAEAEAWANALELAMDARAR
jgi:glycerol kinase